MDKQDIPSTDNQDQDSQSLDVQPDMIELISETDNQDSKDISAEESLPDQEMLNRQKADEQPMAHALDPASFDDEDLPVIEPQPLEKVSTTPSSENNIATTTETTESKEDHLYDDSPTFKASSSKKTPRKNALKHDIKIAKPLKKKLEKINHLILDVDGVLTDGSIYITDQGTGFKRFHSHDGHGIKMLFQNGIEVIILSARKCKATRKRARELGIEEIHTGIADKKDFVADYMKVRRLSEAEVAYIGDDLIDLPAMMLCAVKIIPANGIASMVNAADYQTKAQGGMGAVREVCDMLLHAKGLYQQYLES